MSSDVIVEVGGLRITRDRFLEDLRSVAGVSGDVPAAEDALFSSVLERLVDHYLILEYARDTRIRVTDEEVARAEALIRGEYGEEAFNEELLRAYVDSEDWRRRIHERLLVHRTLEKILVQVPPPEQEDILAYYREHRAEFHQASMVKFRQIVTRDREQAMRILERIRAGEDMEALARRHSVAPEAEAGGVVGWVAKGQLDPVMENAVFSLRPGEVSRVTRSPYGYHVFQVMETRPARTRTLPEVLGEIEARLAAGNREQYLERWLQEMRARTRIKINRALLEEAGRPR